MYLNIHETATAVIMQKSTDFDFFAGGIIIIASVIVFSTRGGK